MKGIGNAGDGKARRDAWKENLSETGDEIISKIRIIPIDNHVTI